MTGAEIKAFRRRELLTQEMLAQAIGTLQAHISGWEKESRPIPAEQEAKLRQLVGASPQERWEMLAEIRKNKAEAEHRRKLARRARPKKPPKPPEAAAAQNAAAKGVIPCKGCPPLAAHGQCEKQDHVLRLPPGDRPCSHLRRRAYIPAA